MVLLRPFPQSKPIVCAAVAGLFAWHPFPVDLVVCVSERKDVLSIFDFNYVKDRSWKKYVLPAS